METSVAGARPEGEKKSIRIVIGACVLAAASVAAALGVTLVIRQITENPTFFAFYLAIFACVWFGGRAPGLVALALSAFALYGMSIGGQQIAPATRELPTLAALLLSWLGAELLSAQRHRAERALRMASERLELTVQQRTAELTRANEGLLREVAERKRAEAALRTTEERWRRLYEASSAGMGLARVDGVFTGANPALQRMLDLTEDEIKGRTAVGITYADERAATVDVIAEFRSGKRQEYHVEKRYLRRDGSPVWVNVTTTLVPGTEADEPFLQAIYVDITERKHAEEALRASEERWRTVFATAPVGIGTLGLDGRFLSANPAFQRMVGYSEEELRNLTGVDVTHEDDRAVTQVLVDDLAAGHRPSYRVEKRYRRQDNQVIWVDVHTSIVPATDITPAFYAGVVVDITDRKRAEAAVRAGEERWRAVFEASSVGVAISDADGRIAAANPAFQQMVGYGEAELKALGWQALNHEDDWPAARALVAGLLEGRQETYAVDKRYRHRNGQVVWVSVNAAHVEATDATPAFIASIIVDITGRRRAEEALRRSQAELARVVRLTTMGELGASIAHEINQPLAAIVASGNACRRWLTSGQNVGRAKESLERIIEDANRASEIIKRIRALTRNRAPEYIRLDMNQIVEEVLAFTQGDIHAKQVMVRKDLLEGLPAIIGDRIQLQQVLMNLIANGLDAMLPITDRRRELTIMTRLSPDDGVAVTVQDSGTGLVPEDRQRIFEAFFTTKSDGMGLGLSISSSIIEAHGGRLHAFPADPHGTAFCFTLPVPTGSPP